MAESGRRRDRGPFALAVNPLGLIAQFPGYGGSSPLAVSKPAAGPGLAAAGWSRLPGRLARSPWAAACPGRAPPGYGASSLPQASKSPAGPGPAAETWSGPPVRPARHCRHQ